MDGKKVGNSKKKNALHLVGYQIVWFKLRQELLNLRVRHITLWMVSRLLYILHMATL
jgi:hypothetical protein